MLSCIDPGFLQLTSYLTAMASFFRSFLILSFLPVLVFADHYEILSRNYYHKTCPRLHGIVRSSMSKVIDAYPRMGASILRLFFHDCFVQGCDASVLLDDDGSFIGEKNALPNKNSLRGFEVIDGIKALVEKSCSATVSCADILALAARDAVVLLNGPNWEVALGRKDSKTASMAEANTELPPPFAGLSMLTAMFEAKGLSPQDMTALSGAHTVGEARCVTCRSHIYNDTDIDLKYANSLQQNCPLVGGDDNLAHLDYRTPTYFDNSYYKDLVGLRGLMHSDQELYNHGSQDWLVSQYAYDQGIFFEHFVEAMVKMGSLGPTTGNYGEIRANCRKVNGY